ncbi:MAG TPA: hypothetical protein PKD55_13805 [Bellilinea sp.]|nr:hypothetical protein [Bellilinea sp.]
MATQELDLATIFKAVTKDLKKNQTYLNESDEYNHNHGDNMVNTFRLITNAVKKTGDQPIADQLAYAAQVLTKKGVGGTSQRYAEGLQRASNQFQGKSGLDLNTILNLVMMLLGSQGGGSQQSSGGGNLLGGLLDMFLGGGQQSQPQQPRPSDSGPSVDWGQLLGGGQQSQPQQPRPSDSGPSMDWGQLIGMGAQLLGSQGQSSGFSSQAPSQSDVLGQLVQGFLSNSSMSEQPRQNESGQVVANSILNLLGGVLGK